MILQADSSHYTFHHKGSETKAVQDTQLKIKFKINFKIYILYANLQVFL